MSNAVNRRKRKSKEASGIHFTHRERTEKKYTVGDAVRAAQIHIQIAMDKATEGLPPLEKAMEGFVLPRMEVLGAVPLGSRITLQDLNVIAVHLTNETLNYYFDMQD